MIYWILLVALILVLRNVVLQMPEGMQRQVLEDKYCRWAWFIIVLMAALRSDKVGADTFSYMIDYLSMPSYNSFSDLNNRYEGYLGYYYASKVFSMCQMPLQVWFGFVEALYAFALYQFTKRFSKDKLFSILIFVTSGLFMFSLAGMKQVASMSLMLMAFLSFLDKKYIKMVLCILGSYSCHSAGLIFLAVFPLYFLRNRRYFVSLVLTTGIVSYIYGNLFMSKMVDILGEDHFESYLENDDSYTSVTLIYYCVILGLSTLGYNYYKKNDPNIAKFVLGTSFLVCSMQSLAGLSPNMFRLALCYAPFLMILLPNASYYYRNKHLGWIIIGCVVFYFLYANRNTPYSFFFF